MMNVFIRQILLLLLLMILISTGPAVIQAWPISKFNAGGRKWIRSRSLDSNSNQDIDDASRWEYESHDDHTRRVFLSQAAVASASLGVLAVGGAGMSFEPACCNAATTTASVSMDAFRPNVKDASDQTQQIPFSSVRRYKIVQLPTNGMSVLLVSDKMVYRPSAALTIGGAGQFADPSDLPGLAHLMEHMILSNRNSKKSFRKPRDFEDWLSDVEGASNAFTAYQNVCFHFSCPFDNFQEALDRFAALFIQEDVEAVCLDTETLKREIRRVDAELDFDNVNVQCNYLMRDFVNLEHPYARFSAGSMETLERRPKEAGIDVGRKLIEFFHRNYLPSQTVLVVVSTHDFATMERFVSSFNSALSRSVLRKDRTMGLKSQTFPGGFLQGNRYKQLVVYRKNGDSELERMSFEWPLNLDYRELKYSTKQAVTGTQVAFIISQILERRGPGSLYLFLLRRAWIPDGSSGLPRISLTFDVSGFQIIKFELLLTQEGFSNRSAVAAAVYDSIDALRSVGGYIIPRDLLAQYATVAKLHGYVLSPRPPDAVELARDAQVYGLDENTGVGSGRWYRYPATEDRLALASLQRVLAATLTTISDPSSAVIMVTAGAKSVAQSTNLPMLSSRKWLTEPLTGALFLYDDFLGLKSRLEELVLTRMVDREELLRPVLNPLIPPTLRPARNTGKVLSTMNANEKVVSRSDWDKVDEMERLKPVIAVDSRFNAKWLILEAIPGQMGVPLPRCPPEPTCRCCFALQLLSPRAARADVRQAARAELWKVSYEMAVIDIAELGVPGGHAYGISFNKFGLRLIFLGPSQTISSYARRLTRRLADHQQALLIGPEMLPRRVREIAIAGARRAPGLSPVRRGPIISNLRVATAYEVAAEGNAFLRSCTGAVCFGEGDLLKKEVVNLRDDLHDILIGSVGSVGKQPAAVPRINDINYKPIWKPRYASPCAVTGVPLVADACGRVPR